MQTDFDAARAAGVKLIPRFAYTDNVNTGSCGSWICPPYGDAPKSQILAHIEQVGPILKKNRDVIAAIQMGWIGVWGEQYYTDYFGDASQGPNFKLTDTNWADRIEVLEAFLAATPSDRMIQARYPQMKQRAIYGISAPTNSAALLQAEAYQGDYKSRIGFHNDCYLASDDDFGTFTDYGSSNTSSQSDTINLKPYMATDSKYVVVGGETCSANGPDDDCFPGGRADTEMRRMHYSYLNAEYNYPDVNSDWDAVCADDMKRELGYRFYLNSASINSSAETNGAVDVSLHVQNLGYAAPYNERIVELILRHTDTGQKVYAHLDSDPRYWFSGEIISINESICIPPDMSIGDYDVLLNLPDPQASLIDRPEYSIRLASALGPDEVWEPTTGYNDLGLTLNVQNGSPTSSCSAVSAFDYCHSSLKISNVDDPSYQAAISIESDANVDQNTSFVFGQWLLLQPGFTVPIGLIFESIVGECPE